MYPPLIFDCDGVLVDSEAAYLTVELAALAALGVRYDRTSYVRTFMGLSPDRWRRDLAADVEARTGAPLPPAFFVELDATGWTENQAEDDDVTRFALLGGLDLTTVLHSTEGGFTSVLAPHVGARTDLVVAFAQAPATATPPADSPAEPQE